MKYTTPYQYLFNNSAVREIILSYSMVKNLEVIGQELTKAKYWLIFVIHRFSLVDAVGVMDLPLNDLAVLN